MAVAPSLRPRGCKGLERLVTKVLCRAMATGLVGPQQSGAVNLVFSTTLAPDFTWDQKLTATLYGSLFGSFLPIASGSRLLGRLGSHPVPTTRTPFISIDANREDPPPSKKRKALSRSATPDDDASFAPFDTTHTDREYETYGTKALSRTTKRKREEVMDEKEEKEE
ncbi:hypothetical protein QBC47DRAFT_362083 [Echria macrotheca]|uniref:Uncharacterized protein n=1 Tax=Echria macrotheca TaxID=438768 RepID=A0AAJ0F877_9PEZI|nr:hypothetical protein QBC47DRAFT_362083 [Echria macrotheca]